MNTHGEIKVDLHSFLNLELSGVEWSALCPRFLPSETLPPLLKAISLQAWSALTVSGVGGSQIWRMSAHEGGKVVRSRHRPPLLPENIPGTYFYYRLSRPLGNSAAGRVKSVKHQYSMRNRPRDLPTCSAMPQPTAPPCAPKFTAWGIINLQCVLWCICCQWQMLWRGGEETYSNIFLNM